MSANRLTVASAKGGVGKTTTAINIGGGLNRRGHDVLLVDADPQGVATEGLGHLEAYDDQPPTLADALLDGDRRDVANDIIRDHPEMDLLPSNVDMLRAERELTVADMAAEMLSDPEASVDLDSLLSSTSILRESAIDKSMAHARHQLDTVLDAVAADYDYVVIDSPPYYGEILDNCLYAAPNVVIPALAEGTSQRAIELLYDELDAVENETGVYATPALAIANRIRASTNEAKEMLEWFDTAFAETPLFKIRERVDLQYAFDAGESIFEYNAHSDMADVFDEAAAALEDHFDD